MLEKQNQQNLNLLKEFYMETKTRLLADKIRVHGITSRIKDDVFNEYINLGEKKDYVCQRIKMAEHVLDDISLEQVADASTYCRDNEDLIINCTHSQSDNKVVKNFCAETKYKSANDELYEALQEFKFAVSGQTENQKVAKVQMAETLFELSDQDDAVLNFMADHFVDSGMCADLMNKLKVLSEHGEQKWKKHGDLVCNSRITAYCGKRLKSQDYQYNVSDIEQEIKSFVKSNLRQAGKGKKTKFIGLQKIKQLFNQTSKSV